MGFLSDYDATEKIDVGRGYWVEIRVCIPRDKMEQAEKILTSAMAKRDNGREIQGDTSSYRTYMVCASIVSWNLDDDGGAVWPYNNDAAIRRGVMQLPSQVFDQIWARVDDLNKPETPAERAAFREADGGSDPDGGRGGVDAGEVPAGDGTVA